MTGKTGGAETGGVGCRTQFRQALTRGFGGGAQRAQAERTAAQAEVNNAARPKRIDEAEVYAIIDSLDEENLNLLFDRSSNTNHAASAA